MIADINPSAVTETVTSSTNIIQDIGTGIKKFEGDINITNPESQIRQDIADFSAYDYGKSAVTGAVDTLDIYLGFED